MQYSCEWSNSFQQICCTLWQCWTTDERTEIPMPLSNSLQPLTSYPFTMGHNYAIHRWSAVTRTSAHCKSQTPQGHTSFLPCRGCPYLRVMLSYLSTLSRLARVWKNWDQSGMSYGRWRELTLPPFLSCLLEISVMKQKTERSVIPLQDHVYLTVLILWPSYISSLTYLCSNNF